MVQYETDSITASRALANLVPTGASVSVCPTKNGTTVIAVDDAHADKLRELIGVEEPKKFRVFLALASVTAIDYEQNNPSDKPLRWSHYPWVGLVTARNYKDAIDDVYAEFVARTYIYSDRGHAPYMVDGQPIDSFSAICREMFVLVQHVEGDKETVVFRSDPLSGRVFSPDLLRKMRETILLGQEAQAAGTWPPPINHLDVQSCCTPEVDGERQHAQTIDVRIVDKTKDPEKVESPVT